MRGSVILPPEAGISFRWMGPSREKIVVHGHVSDIRMTNAKTAEYSIEISMPLSVRDRLARELEESQRRRMVKAFESEPADDANEETVFDGDVGALTKRKFYRAMVSFPVIVKTRGKNGRWVSSEAEARDLSVGGMMMMLSEDIAEGTELELSFSLPAYAEPKKNAKNEVVEITPFGERRIKKAPAPKAATSIETRARVLKKLGQTRGGAPLYGVNFIELPSFYTEELARWIHAHQLKQIRKPATSSRRAAGSANALPPLMTRKARTVFRPRHIEVARSVLSRAIAERRYGPPTFARDTRELVRVPTHAPAPLIEAGSDDVFGFGESITSVRVPASQKPRECYIAGDADVFGLGMVEKAS